MNPDNYLDQLSWLFGQFPNYQNQGQLAYKPGLDNTIKLLNSFKNPHTKLKGIHVAGTNGKGSVCSYVSTLLQEKKWNVGLFTSPHLWDFRERIRVNGRKITKAYVIDFCKRIQALDLSFEVSFFEITFVMALSYFEKAKCDYIVIETGMGGRLDATNTFVPELSIITNIGLDHTQFLGKDLVSIAKEKAGIIKPKVPVLIGQFQKEVHGVFEKTANQLDAPLHLAQSTKVVHDKLNTDYKKINFSTALSALDILNVPYNHKIIARALNNLEKNTGLLGRFTKIHSSPNIFIDVAHNVDGLECVLKEFENKPLHIVYGASSDKAYQEILALCSTKSTVHLCAFTNSRSWDKQEMETVQKKLPNIASIHSNINDAIDNIIPQLQKGENLLICGSFFLIADLEISKYNYTFS